VARSRAALTLACRQSVRSAPHQLLLPSALYTGSMLVRDFAFALPPELIAQQPLRDRAAARMLTLDRQTGELAHRSFRDFPCLLGPGDVLVLNDSRVLPSRLFAQPLRRRVQAGQQPARIEVMLVEELASGEWRALLRPARKANVGEELVFRSAAGDPLLRADVTGAGEFGERLLRFVPVEDFFAALDVLGHVPLPPYIHRPDEQADRERYQTVYARERGSVAAPTAGLHFTPEILAEIRARGVQVEYVTLHVGLGTFQPVRVESTEKIELHTERYTLPAATAEAVNRAKAEGRRVIAAGTTTVRTLEHCARVRPDGLLEPHSGATSIFLQPGAEFRLVDALLTNFHLPESTLLMLVCAFAGHHRVMGAYQQAVVERYRFFSYGDCMFLR
jgi:S-adenosylmethionine:tRNA ribosyltransferase-isomerase